jgi:ankyrin repeat protein
MNRTGRKPDFPQSTYGNIFSDDSAAIPGRQYKAQDFQSQLESIIVCKQLSDLEKLIQVQPEAWSCINPEDLGKLLLRAVKKGRLDQVGVLITKAMPGTVEAISLDMQLELVEAARFERNSELETNKLLNILLQAVDCPVQHLDRLVQVAMNGKYFALCAFLSLYKANLEKARNEQYQQSIYDAAAGGDAAKLQKELDAKLGIPPLDDTLTGTAWLFNMLHRWVAELFNTGAVKTLVNASMGKLPLLHAAVESGSKEAVLLLVEKGADLSTTDAYGDTALSRARSKENTEIVALLEKLHAPDRAPVPGGVLALTQAGSDRRRVAGQALPRHEGMTDRPGYSNTIETFKSLLPDVASGLSGSVDLERELNGGASMSVGQVGLFTASYLAEFKLSRALNRQERRGTLTPQTNTVVSQLQANREKFRAEGMRLEASKAKDIHRVLDNLCSTEFSDDSTIPSNIQQYLQNAGLCNLLIASVMKSVVESSKNSDWLSASGERRKGVFTAILREQLSELPKKRPDKKEQDTQQALYDQLLRRQIDLLESYCKAADAARTAHAVQATDFSNDFR